MSKERVPRAVKIAKAEQNWLYYRSGMDEKPVKDTQGVKPVVLFDEGTMRRGWYRERFPGVIEE